MDCRFGPYGVICADKSVMICWDLRIMGIRIKTYRTIRYCKTNYICDKKVYVQFYRVIFNTNIRKYII